MTRDEDARRVGTSGASFGLPGSDCLGLDDVDARTTSPAAPCQALPADLGSFYSGVASPAVTPATARAPASPNGFVGVAGGRITDGAGTERGRGEAGTVLTLKDLSIDRAMHWLSLLGWDGRVQARFAAEHVDVEALSTVSCEVRVLNCLTLHI